MTSDLVEALVQLDEDNVLRIIRSRLEKGESGLVILQDAMKAMEIIGDRFEKQEYFLPELIYSGEILKKAFALPGFDMQVRKTGEETKAKILIGTVAGDIHDIGKDIVVNILKANGFAVGDLGVDVPAEKFVEEIRRVRPSMLGLSGLLTIAYEGFKQTIDAITDAGLRNEVKIVIGGPAVDDHLKSYSGADAYCRDVMCGVALARKWVGGKKQ
jgi:methanogenic corrinoid protein MtbC1